MPQPLDRRLLVLAGLSAATAAMVAGCQQPVPAPPPAALPPAAPPPGPAAAPAPTPITTMRTSAATNPRAYREDAATHLYGINRDRIWKGRMPPLLYAIGVLQVEIDGQGRVQHLSWMRAPKHAPEVIAEIERTVKAASPYPAPVRMGKVVYTDTWLWHKSGQFQLDTLTEGQD